MNENELTQIEIDILDKMCLDNEEDKEFNKWYKKNNNNIKDHIKNESLIFEKYIMEEEIKKEDNSIPNNRLPNRANEEYTKIENYEDYEFTHCIAYEMATRNEEVIKLTNLMEKLNLLRYNILENFNSLQNYEEKIVQLSLLIDFLIKSIKINYKDSLKSIFEIHNRLSKNMNLDNIEIVTDKFLEIINPYENSYLITILNNYSGTYTDSFQSKYNESNLKSLFKKASQQDKFCLISLLLISTQTKLEKEYYIVNEHKSIKPKFIEEFISKDTNYEPSLEINNHICTIFTDPNYKEKYIHKERNGYTAYQGAYENDNSFTINKVIPNFQQPLRMFNTMDISINPSLPLNDILSFVKKIKEDYDKEETFKSFFELIEKDFNNSENTTITKKIKFDKLKWADVFYIYDYFKFRKNKNNTIYNIMEELSFQLTFYYNKLHNKNNPNNLKPIPENLTDGELDFENFSYTKEHDFNNELYLSADHIRKFFYKNISGLIEGENPEYKKLIDGRNHDKNSLIDGKNNDSSRL